MGRRYFEQLVVSNTHITIPQAHFGKFGSHYIKRTFYFDVHPPLGKMLVGLAGVLSGYDGNYEFKSGEVYPPNVPYVSMRVMMAMFGMLMVPLAWFTAVELHLSRRACHLVTLMVLCGMSSSPLSRSRIVINESSFIRFGLDYYQQIHSPRLYAPLLHIHDCVFHGQIQQSAMAVILSGMVVLAQHDWSFNRLCC